MVRGVVLGGGPGRKAAFWMCACNGSVLQADTSEGGRTRATLHVVQAYSRFKAGEGTAQKKTELRWRFDASLGADAVQTWFGARLG